MFCQSPITKNSVSFSGKVRIRAALHIDDYSEEEKGATWLSDEDMQRIHGEIRYTVQMMDWHNTVDENEYSGRGLEYMTSDGIAIRRKDESVAAVLDEQFLQEEEHFFDEEELANTYRDCAYRWQVIARRSGLADMRSARSLALEYDESNSKLSRVKL
jgi:predicted enzyme involved in methoxymalonyl-ACP biosynthesis